MARLALFALFEFLILIQSKVVSPQTCTIDFLNWSNPRLVTHTQPTITWPSLRSGFLPPNASIAVQSSESAAFFFYAPRGPLDAIMNYSAMPAAPAHLSVSQQVLFDSLQRGGGSEGHYRYYSAQFADARNGTVTRAVASPIGGIVAREAAFFSQALSISLSLQGNVWLASAGACTPLHYDASANLFSQYLGEKVVVLYPPEAATAAQLFPFASALRRSSSRPATLGLLHQPLVFTLKPGQNLFIPPYWLHHVCSSSPSFSLSLWAETLGQRAAKRLLGMALPFEQQWNVTERIFACALLFHLLCSTPIQAADASAALRSRYSELSLLAADAQGETLAALCTAQSTALAAAREPRIPPQGIGEGFFAAGLMTGELLTPWLAAARGALDEQSSPAVRAIVLANWMENALLFALRLVATTGGSTSHSAPGNSSSNSAYLLPNLIMCI